MGCGGSKAADIDESSITIKRRPTEQAAVVKVNDSVQLEELDHNTQSLDQSVAVETEVYVVQDTRQPVAFDIPFNDNNGAGNRKISYPQRLEKLSTTAPLPTKEQLDDKLRAASQRKDEELRKRKESRRASKIRREIMETRELENAHQKSNEVSFNDNNDDRRKVSLSENMEVDMTYNTEDNDSGEPP